GEISGGQASKGATFAANISPPTTRVRVTRSRPLTMTRILLSASDARSSHWRRHRHRKAPLRGVIVTRLALRDGEEAPIGRQRAVERAHRLLAPDEDRSGHIRKTARCPAAGQAAGRRLREAVRPAAAFLWGSDSAPPQSWRSRRSSREGRKSWRSVPGFRCW